MVLRKLIIYTISKYSENWRKNMCEKETEKSQLLNYYFICKHLRLCQCLKSFLFLR